ncbi:MAG: cobalamin B12-binding domain-containing protein [Dehalococcoidia bacterium]|nr:cobalamin B12-binding domain-containing protein [Dehalococcoidia bacterium]
MKTLLINPPYAFSEFPIIPMGLLYLGAVLERNGYEVEVLDLLVSRYSRDKIKRKLEQYQPDIVGTTCVTMNYPIASDTLKYCKSLNPDITAVIGGPHVTFAPVETLNESAWIDIVVRGEGELTMLDIVSGKDRAAIDGIAYRAEGVHLTRERCLIENLDELPLPARHLFPTARYLALDAHLSLITGRGCPFNCVFCVGSKMGGRRARFRNPKLVVDEIEQSLKLGFKEVNFEDDLFTLNHRHLHGICDEIVSRGLKFNWSVFARVDTVNPQVLEKLREAGCTWLCYGIESGNQQILDRVKKKITLERVRESVKMAKDAGVSVLASFIIGLPGETRQTLAETMEFARELDTYYGFHVLAPFPGTEVREKADEFGIEILTNDWSKYDANRPVTRTPGASPEDLTAALHKYYRGLRLSPDKAEEGVEDHSEEARSRRRSPLAWTLLHGDIIESLGRIRVDSGPAEDLAARISDLVPYPRKQIDQSLNGWISQGLLNYEVVDSHSLWRWG